MESPRHVSVYARSDVGLRRDSNEDQFAVEAETAEHAPALPTVRHFATESPVVCMVSDGMGGALAGEVASLMAVQTVSSRRLEANGNAEQKIAFLEHVIEAANNRIYDDASLNVQHRGMGATATIVVIQDQYAYFGQVGDSRAYVLREGELYQITNDQTAVEFFLRSGMITEREAINHPRGNIVLQALGTDPSIDPEISQVTLARDDLLLICSDGLSGLVDDAQLLALLLKHHDLVEATDALVEAANLNGGIDNITALLIRCEGDGFPPPEPGLPEMEILRSFELPSIESPPEKTEHPQPTSPQTLPEPDAQESKPQFGLIALMLAAMIGFVAWWLLR